MTLAATTRGRVATPLRALIYGTEGVGKSTLAAAAKNPIVLDTEEGTSHLDVVRFPRPESWQDVFDALVALVTGQHDYHTLVIDTIDGIEPLCWRHVCASAGKTDIESFGFAKGYIAALDEWRRLVAALDVLQAKRRMDVLLIGHAVVRTFKNPAGPDFDRYALKIHEKAAGLLKEHVDCVLFCAHEEYVNEEGKRPKGVSTGERVMHTVRAAAWDAKNRYGLPETLPLKWDAFTAAIVAHWATTSAAIAEKKGA